MSELGETFRAYREERHSKRRSNLESSIKTLTARGHKYKMLSESHVRVSGYDFWPSTGKWLSVKTKRGGRGLLGLLCKLEKSHE